MQAPPTYQDQYAPPPRRNNVVWIILAVVLVCGCGGVIGGAAILFPVFQQAKVSAKRTQCLSNMKRLGLAQVMYTTDYDDRYPFTRNWNESIASYAQNDLVFTCPSLAEGSEGGYAMNAAHNGKKLSTIADPATEIDLYETANLSPNASGNPATEPPPNRHGKGRSVTYANGTAKWIKAD